MPKSTPSLSANILSDAAISVVAGTSAIVAIAATSYDEDAAIQTKIDENFPENELVLVSNYREALENVGAFGTLKNVLTDLAQISAPLLIIVRVPETDEEAATDAEINAALDQLAFCEQVLKLKPDYLGAPGLETAAVINKLDLIAVSLDATPYAVLPSVDKTAAITLNNALTGSGGVKTLWPDFVGYDGRAAAIALAMRAKITAENTQMMGPHKTLGNVPIPLVESLTKNVSWDLSGKTGDVKALNEAGITSIVYFDGAWRFWGDQLRNGTFENIHLVNLAFKKILLAQEAKFTSFPMTKSLIKNIMANVEDQARVFKAKGWIVGFALSFDPETNTGATLSAGEWTLDIEFTATRPASKGVINLTETTKFYSSFAKEVVA